MKAPIITWLENVHFLQLYPAVLRVPPVHVKLLAALGVEVLTKLAPLYLEPSGFHMAVWRITDRREFANSFVVSQKRQEWSFTARSQRCTGG